MLKQGDKEGNDLLDSLGRYIEDLFGDNIENKTPISEKEKIVDYNKTKLDINIIKPEQQKNRDGSEKAVDKRTTEEKVTATVLAAISNLRTVFSDMGFGSNEDCDRLSGTVKVIEVKDKTETVPANSLEIKIPELNLTNFITEYGAETKKVLLKSIQAGLIIGAGSGIGIIGKYGIDKYNNYSAKMHLIEVDAAFKEAPDNLIKLSDTYTHSLQKILDANAVFPPEYPLYPIIRKKAHLKMLTGKITIFQMNSFQIPDEKMLFFIEGQDAFIVDEQDININNYTMVTFEKNKEGKIIKIGLKLVKKSQLNDYSNNNADISGEVIYSKEFSVNPGSYLEKSLQQMYSTKIAYEKFLQNIPTAEELNQQSSQAKEHSSKLKEKLLKGTVELEFKNGNRGNTCTGFIPADGIETCKSIITARHCIERTEKNPMVISKLQQVKRIQSLGKTGISKYSAFWVVKSSNYAYEFAPNGSDYVVIALDHSIAKCTEQDALQFRTNPIIENLITYLGHFTQYGQAGGFSWNIESGKLTNYGILYEGLTSPQIKFDLKAIRGNSGGPLVDKMGNVMAVTSSATQLAPFMTFAPYLNLQMVKLTLDEAKKKLKDVSKVITPSNKPRIK